MTAPYDNASGNPPADKNAEAWEANAPAWTKAVREGRIASRVEATDAAILGAIASRAPHTVLDIGCGEGWLCRKVREQIGSETVGLDGAAAMIAAAREADPRGVYDQASYTDLIADCWPRSCWEAAFDVIVFNFSLFDQDLEPILKAAKTRLAKRGVILIQTVTAECLPRDEDAGEKDAGETDFGQKTENFDAFGGGDWQPTTWHCQRNADLLAVFDKSGLRLTQSLHVRARSVDRNTPLSAMYTLAID